MNSYRIAASRARWIAIVLAACMPVGVQGGDGHSVGMDVVDDTGENEAVEHVQIEYVCGKLFAITNSGEKPVTVMMRVKGTKEKAFARLKAAPKHNPEFSEVFYKTRGDGSVELFRGDEQIGVRQNGGFPCIPAEGEGATGTEARAAVAAAPAAAALASTDMGEWSPVFSWPNVAVHLHLLPNGQVLSWGNSDGPQLWNPETSAFTPAPSSDNLFCAGHAFLPDGRLLVAGGHIDTGRGLADINTYTAAAGWVSQPAMQRGRWYPSVTVMPNGEAVIIAGRDEAGQTVQVPEVWSSAGGLRRLTGASLGLPYYPRAFLAPNGKLFYAGEQQVTRYLDVTGKGKWTTVGNLKFGARPYGSAVMYDKGKILYSGGARTTNTAEVIDLNVAAPAWRWTAPMAFARRHHNLVLLPTGEVLAVAGVAGTTFDDLTKPVLAAEIWNPTTETWRTVASSAITRGYHASSILLPDGRVLLSGSGDGVAGTPRQRNAEIYSPPYLFAGARPTITSAPTTAKFGATIQVGSPEAASIADVSLIRLGSTTHAFDNNQRFLRPTFTANASGLSVKLPGNRKVAPPGHYMLFILNGAGVPSVAKILQIT